MRSSSLSFVGCFFSLLAACGAHGDEIAGPAPDVADGSRGGSAGASAGTGGAAGTGTTDNSGGAAGAPGTVGTHVSPKLVWSGGVGKVWGVTDDELAIVTVNGGLAAIPLAGGEPEIIVAKSTTGAAVAGAGIVIDDQGAISYWTKSSGLWSDPARAATPWVAQSDDGNWTVLLRTTGLGKDTGVNDVLLGRPDHAKEQLIAQGVVVSLDPPHFYGGRVALTVHDSGKPEQRLLSMAMGDSAAVIIDQGVTRTFGIDAATGRILYAKSDGSLLTNDLLGSAPEVVAATVSLTSAGFAGGGVVWSDGGTHFKSSGGAEITTMPPPSGGAGETISPDGRWAVTQTLDQGTWLTSRTTSTPPRGLPNGGELFLFTADSSTLLIALSGEAVFGDPAGAAQPLPVSVRGGLAISGSALLLFEGKLDAPGGELVVFDASTHESVHIDDGAIDAGFTKKRDRVVYSVTRPDGTSGLYQAQLP